MLNIFKSLSLTLLGIAIIFGIGAALHYTVLLLGPVVLLAIPFLMLWWVVYVTVLEY